MDIEASLDELLETSTFTMATHTFLPQAFGVVVRKASYCCGY